MSFKAFLDAAKAIVTLGASTNATARQEIRNVVGELTDELDRALSLTDSYLVGAKFSADDRELAHYLADVDGKLRGSFHEHHICAGLHHLADKFGQLFDPTRFSVSIANHSEIPTLVNKLQNREQVVIDDLEDMVNKLRDCSSRLYDGKMSRAEVLAAVEAQREDIAQHRQAVKDERRTLLGKL